MQFETERTRRFRAGSLDDGEARTIAQIEEFGCSLVQVCEGGDADKHLFSYTIGVFDTCGQPEIICVGAKLEAVRCLLNEAASQLREGINLAKGRHRDLIGEVDCEFRPVDRKWVKHVMGWADWYYDGADFPVLQAIYPDLENRFPGEEGFNEYFTQPLLQPGAPQTQLEEDFWASNDLQSSLFDWRFPEPPHTGVYLSQTVHEGVEAVTYVSHDIEDGAWQFLSDSMSDGGGPVLVCLHHPIDKDPSLKELADLPLGWFAERDAPGGSWVRRQQEPE